MVIVQNFIFFCIISLIIIFCMDNNTSNKKSQMSILIWNIDYFCKENFLLYMWNKYIDQNIVYDTYYFLINFLILTLLLARELSTLTWSFGNLTIIPIILFMLLWNNSGFFLMIDFIRLIWYLLLLVKKILSKVYIIKCYFIPVITIL